MSGPGAMARPVASADQPQTSCIHSTSDRSIAPNEIENSVMTIEEPAKPPARKSAGSTSGLRARRQCPTKTVSSAAAMPSVASVAVEPQPQSSPRTSARVSPATPALSSPAPSASGRGTGWPGTFGSRRHPTYSAARPIGTLTRKTHRQSTATSRPPTTGPSAAARPPTAVHARTDEWRRSSGAVARTRLRDAGVSSAAPAPWTTRNATSDSTLVASPHAAEARVKTRTPTRKPSSRLRRSASRPNSTSSDAKAIA